MSDRYRVRFLVWLKPGASPASLTNSHMRTAASRVAKIHGFDPVNITWGTDGTETVIDDGLPVVAVRCHAICKPPQEKRR